MKNSETLFETFTKKKELLICIDSDGCAMDTMNIKHIRCFGPCLMDEWGLEQWESAILSRWNEVNLYTISRGINRFQGLAKVLKEIDEQYTPIPGVEGLVRWVAQTEEWSEGALQREIIQGQWNHEEKQCLKKALCWSQRVNQKIKNLPLETKRSFLRVKEALQKAALWSDLVVVSSANIQALQEEWQVNQLLPYIHGMLAQDAGNKTQCIERLLTKGYEASHVMMIGDSVGDMEAAEANGVFFYPILVGSEEESWKECGEVAVPLLAGGRYAGEYQRKKREEFFKNLERKEEK